MEQYLGADIPKLGFGLMRLPKKDGGIDLEQTTQMVDRFMEAGFNYFDTAFVYDGGLSEEAIRSALVERYPRDSYYLTTKLNASMGAHDEESAKAEIYTSLKRTGAGYFDFYLLHALQRSTYELYEKYGLWDYVADLKAKGLVRHIGFSFHGDPELLTQILTAHPEAEFVQLQINYADWENPGVQSRRCWEIARAAGKPVIIMEPVKGGALANPADNVKEVFRAADPNASLASWALRFAASLEGIITVLSGASSLAQMEDNLACMKNFHPLTEAEYAVIAKAQAALREDKIVPCTTCRYCEQGCPKNIPIPDIFTVMNRQRGNEAFRGVREYNIATQGRGRASDCIACGQCEKICPQHLPVIELLKDCVKRFEEG